MIARYLLVLAFLAVAITAPARTVAFDSAPPKIVRPAELERDIAFWRRVYTEVTTSGGLIHDDARLDVVYEVIDLPSSLSNSARQRRIKHAKARYADILRRLASDPDRQLSSEEARVRALWEGSSPQELRAAAGRVRFQLGQADRFREGLIRSGAWLPYIRDVLQREDLPVELAALPHVESSFNTYAYSKVGAAGMWQFMPGTGRRFLRIDNVVDERLDPYRSTDAAAQFLAQNYAVLGSWPLAITAYNHGTAGMRRAREQLGTDDIARIVRHYRSRSFGFASRNFYVAFLAAVEIDADPARYFAGLSRSPADASQVIVLPHYLPAAALTSALEVDSSLLRALNPSLLDSVWNGSRYVPRGYPLRVPPHLDFSAALTRIPDSERFAAQVPDTHHTVRRGDTLSTIATRYGVSMARVAALNGLRSPYRIRAGEVLVLPTTAAPSQPAESLTEPVAESEEPTVVLAAADAAEAQAGRRAADAAEPEDDQQARIVLASFVEPLDDGSSASIPPLPDAAAPAGDASEPEAFNAEDIGPSLVEGAASASTADPADYTVADDRFIRVEAAETLGHYAEWLDLRASRLRELNGIRYGTLLRIGQRLKLDFSRVSPQEFQDQRVAYHRQLQTEYFSQHHIAGSEVHTVRSGESIWMLSQKRYDLPLWLLRQYNPDVDFAALRPGTRLVIPRVAAIEPESAS